MERGEYLGYYLVLLILLPLIYLWRLASKPMNRVRQLQDVGYIRENGEKALSAVRRVQKARNVGQHPHPYPNGWFAITESRILQRKTVQNVNCLGLSLVVFRAEDGRAHALDAYCPHIGANLGVGGRVFGSCIECPFHGWRFDGDTGRCTRIPYAETVPDAARIKSYDVLELNGFVYLWHHSEGVEPGWVPPQIEQIQTGEWAYGGRTEHWVNAHIEEVPENGADVAHLGQVHSCLMSAGNDLCSMWNKWWQWGCHEWNAGWTPDPSPDNHVGSLRLTHRLRLLGVPLFQMEVLARQIGPAIVYMTFDSPFGRGCFTHSLTPHEPLLQKMIHHVYLSSWLPIAISKFFLLGEAIQIERDIMIWNNKRYAGKPLLVKSKEDAQISRHRRWYAQFYSETCSSWSGGPSRWREVAGSIPSRRVILADGTLRRMMPAAAGERLRNVFIDLVLSPK